MRAFVTLREQPFYRRESFCEGLQKAGYKVHKGYCNDPQPGDVLVIWNRYGMGDRQAQLFESRGLPVLVAENGYMGRDWQGQHWYAISRNRHNGGGSWPAGEGRWKTPLKPWRESGKHILVLPQRGIGVPPVAQPPNWHKGLQIKTDRPIRVREHPGEKACKPLEEDFNNCHAVITWASGGAIKALYHGIPVFHGYREWIGADAAKHWPADLERPFLGDRLPMFERLAWAMWNTDEIASGQPFNLLLRGT